MGFVSFFKGFFASRFNIALFIILVALGAFLMLSQEENRPFETSAMVVHYFYMPGCPHCAEQEPIIRELAEEFKDENITFLFHDVTTQQGYDLFYKMASEAGLHMLGTPTTFVGKQAFVGVHTKEQLKAAILECKRKCIEGKNELPSSQEVSKNLTSFELPIIGRTDLTAFSLPTLAIVLGLIDGFNPCAMWVLVYLIAVLMGINERKKALLIVGIFVFASGVLYFVFMTAWLNFFLFVGYIRAITIAIGLVALAGGILSLKEFILSKELTCKVGDEKSHEKTMKKIDSISTRSMSIALIISVIGLAFAVNSIEFVCSSAIPAVFTQILALHNLPMIQYYAYILLYDFFYMLDDIVIFGLAAFAISGSFGQRYAKFCKGLGGILLTGIGLLLLFAPHMLR